MKKIGYILTILFALLLTTSIYFRLSDGKPMTNTSALIAFLIVVLIVGGIGGILKKSWGGKVAMISVGAVVATQVLQANIISTLIGAVVFGALFYTDK